MRDVEGIRRALRIQSFRPFALKMVDGTVYTVQHPHRLIIPPVHQPREAWYVVITDPESGSEEYQMHRIDLDQAEMIVPPGPAAASPAQPKTEGDGE